MEEKKEDSQQTNLIKQSPTAPSTSRLIALQIISILGPILGIISDIILVKKLNSNSISVTITILLSILQFIASILNIINTLGREIQLRVLFKTFKAYNSTNIMLNSISTAFNIIAQIGFILIAIFSINKLSVVRNVPVFIAFIGACIWSLLHGIASQKITNLEYESNKNNHCLDATTSFFFIGFSFVMLIFGVLSFLINTNGIFRIIFVIIYYISMMILFIPFRTNNLADYAIDVFFEHKFFCFHKCFKHELNLFNPKFSNAAKLKKNWNQFSKIAIIGGGPAGVHMASMLINHGYKNVTIYEKDNRIGGKSYTYWDEHQVPHEFGTCYQTPQYYIFKDIRSKYDPENKEMEMEELTGILLNESSDKPISLDKFVTMKIEDMHIENDKLKNILPDILSSAIPIVKALTNYKNGYIDTFGTTRHVDEGFTMPPKPKDISKINMSFLDWLKKYDCKELVPMLLYTNTAQAYGLLHEIPAYYGLSWNRPDMLLSLIDLQDRLRRKVKGIPVQPCLYNGFQSVWEKVVEKDKINYKMNSEVIKINRNMNDNNKPIILTIKNNKNGKTNNIECDVLFMAINQKLSLNMYENPTNDEKEVFSPIIHDTIYTTLYAADKEAGDRQPFMMKGEMWPESLERNQGELYAHRHSLRVVRPEWFDKPFNNTEHAIAYQFMSYEKENNEKNNNYYKNLLIKNLKNRGETNVKILKQMHWEYFPKWKLSDIIKGYPWKVRDEMQGKIKNTYYIGSSVSFESILHVLCYNHELMVQLGIAELYH